MLEIKITLDAAPGLSELLAALTNALGQAHVSVHPKGAPAASTVAAPSASAVAAAEEPKQEGVPAAVPQVPVAAAAPVAPAPSYTAEQVGKAGSEFISAHPERMGDLMGLLSGYGVQAITELKPDQLGTFATALRGMGARI